MTRQRRILLHPGFHRTGTASIAAYLAANRAALAPHLGLLLPDQLQAAGALCANFASDLNPLRLIGLVDTLDDIFAENGLHPMLNDSRDIVMSCAALSGRLPGAPGVASYEAAPITIAYVAGYLAERFEGAEIMVTLTTRAPHDWLDSTWRTQLGRYRLKEDWPDFSAAHARAANLGHALMKTAHAIDPVAAFSLPLEEAREHPHGPGGALLELMDLPDAVRLSLRPVGREGAGPQANVAAQLLELNRSDLPRATLESEKQLVLRAGFAAATRAADAAPVPPPAASLG